MKTFNRWKRSICKRLLKAKIIKPKVIVFMDGGICSQMYQYLVGALFTQKGYKVCYDLSFYKEWGTDLNYQFVRNFDLLKAFPYLKLEQASNMDISIYKREYYYPGNHTVPRSEDYSFLEKNPPIYLGGYYLLPLELYLNTFRKLFHLNPQILDIPNNLLCEEIKSQTNSIAVHVRRGDLKIEVYAYGKPASSDYFKNAITYFKDRKAHFYFFSDEPDWVSQTLLPLLPLSDNYKVVNINGSDKGYMDLYLIAHCKHQITSKGSLGKYGALLMDNPRKTVILCDDETEYSWKPLFQ